MAEHKTRPFQPGTRPPNPTVAPKPHLPRPQLGQQDLAVGRRRRRPPLKQRRLAAAGQEAALGLVGQVAAAGQPLKLAGFDWGVGGGGVRVRLEWVREVGWEGGCSLFYCKPHLLIASPLSSHSCLLSTPQKLHPTPFHES